MCIKKHQAKNQQKHYMNSVIKYDKLIEIQIQNNYKYWSALRTDMRAIKALQI